MELSQEQIIKALECCASPEYKCEECPIDQKKKDDCVCGQFLAGNAVALIKELTEENEALTSNLVKQTAANVMLFGENKRLQCHVNRLKKYDEERDIALHARLISETRANTVREMAKRLKGCREKVDGLAFRLVSFDTIDRIKEEMINEHL